MQTEKPRHHVIFLGAGASLTSGYPIGEKLRLRLANENHFFSDLDKAFPKNQIGHKTSKGEETEAICLEYFRRFKPVVELFRHGGFGTVDEFSKLAADKYPEHTQDMKKLMRLAFALHNPEDSFHKSDYYPFIQRLFSDDLHSLKSNITIISYNYDCYLDYLLLKAYEYRKRLSASPEINPITKNTLTSGFFEPTDITWAEKIRGFNYFKLHGSIAYANGKEFNHRLLFESNVYDRLDAFARTYYKNSVPPIVFPWELFGPNREFINANDFIFVKQADNEKQREEGRRLFSLYKAIWGNAAETVMRAEKISFVGLSMHPFLEEGLSWLFHGKKDAVEVVVANLENRNFPNVDDRFHPASLTGRVVKLLRRVAPGLNTLRSSSEHDGNFDTDEIIHGPGIGITPRYSFKEFIEKEMN
jgi:hypothetical protein